MNRWKAARYVLLAVVLAGLFRYVWTHGEEFGVIRLIDTRVIVLLWTLHLAMFVLVAVPFYHVVRGFGSDISFRAWVRIYSASRLLNVFAPQAAAAYRIAELKLSHGFPISSYLAAFGVFTFLSRMFTLVLVVGTILAVQPGLRLGGVMLAPALAFAALAISATVWAAAMLQGRFRQGIRRLLAKLRARPSVADEMLAILRRPGVLLQVFALTSLNFALTLAGHRLLFAAIGAEASYAEIAVLRLSRSVLEVIPLTPGNLGVSEAVYGSLSEVMAIGASEGIIVSAIITMMSMLAVLTAFAISFSWPRVAAIR